MDLRLKAVAVVDNEEDIVTLFTDVIRVNGYFVIGFTNPLFLIDYISEYPDKIQLILIDYRMQHMSGCQLAERVYAINPKIKMVLITAFDDVINNALNLEIIKKPITLPKNLEIIEQKINDVVII
ncbi:MAG TPA: response regulator [Nitrososphaeraceae archaeon]|nr:response regulator [Nitrososphaeraceae archaeon]